MILNEPGFDPERLDGFLDEIRRIRQQPTWEKQPIVDLFNAMIPEFRHQETGRYLDGRM